MIDPIRNAKAWRGLTSTWWADGLPLWDDVHPLENREHDWSWERGGPARNRQRLPDVRERLT